MPLAYLPCCFWQEGESEENRSASNWSIAYRLTFVTSATTTATTAIGHVVKWPSIIVNKSTRALALSCPITRVKTPLRTFSTKINTPINCRFLSNIEYLISIRPEPFSQQPSQPNSSSMRILVLKNNRKINNRLRFSTPTVFEKVKNNYQWAFNCLLVYFLPRSYFLYKVCLSLIYLLSEILEHSHSILVV